MNIAKTFTNLFSYSVADTSVIPADIEDIVEAHKDKEYKESSIFNRLLENITTEFEENIENFKTSSDIDMFKKNIQKKYKYTI